MNFALFSPVSSCCCESPRGREILTKCRFFSLFLYKTEDGDGQHRHIATSVISPPQNAGADTAEECESCCEASDGDMTS